MNSVLYVTAAFPTLAAFIENEVKRIDQRGVKIRVLTLRPVSTQYQPEHAPLVTLTSSVGSPLDLRNWGDLLLWTLRRPHVLIPDFLRILWASKASPYALMGHAGYLPAAARVASIAEREGFERIHGAWAHFPATVAYLASRLTGKRFSMAGHAGGDLYRMQEFLPQKARAADFMTCCVRGNAEMVRRLVPEARVHWLYHGTDLSRFGSIVRARATEPTLLIVGRLARTKGYDDLFKAMAVLKRRGVTPKLVVVGDGPERANLEALAREGGVMEQIQWCGSLTHDQLAPHYAAAWLLVAPSVVLANGRMDGIPNVVVEAMAAGLPVVGTRAAGLEEIVVPGRTGALANQRDPEDLASAIEPLIGDAAEVDRLSAIARTEVREAFDVERNFEKLWALFAGTAEGSRP
ncbi:MAG: glycosyltransferase family 4 protein [Candidatus Eisenbacteria bacterium]|uniref:Glycosyltransferase family 4 protein n=1 Tax=Eiseniibacteriota bacterium TaxID=2212470 RepID=A0A933W397_UNCEI|nr:glycosyltransferase family 4 protein [Candidatus Eisenbacteria bacterium]